MAMTRNPGNTLFRENGVRVNQINQRWVLTETEKARKSAQGLPDDWYKEISNFFPAGRILQPSEIVAVEYWLADESGQVVDLKQYSLIGRNPSKN